MSKTRNKIITFLLGLIIACCMTGVLTACSKDEPQTPPAPAEDVFKPGDVVLDENDVQYTVDADGNVTQKEYAGKDITVKYLLDDNSYVLLSGEKVDDMALVRCVGDLTELALKTIEDNVKIGETNITITSIGDKAFYGNDKLESVDLTKSRKTLSFEIGDQAFYNCTALESVTMPDDVYVDYNTIGKQAFYNCEALADIDLGDKFAEIGAEAFARCTALRAIELSSKQKVIETGTFKNCENLARVTFSDEIRSIHSSAFENTKIADLDLSRYTKLHYIGAKAFEDTEITSIKLPESVSYIGTRAFFNCEKLTNVEIPFIGNTIADRTSTFNAIYGMDKTLTVTPETPVTPEPGDDEQEPEQGDEPSQGDNENDDNEEETDPVIPSRSLNVKVETAIAIPSNVFARPQDIRTLSIGAFLTPGTYAVYGMQPNAGGDLENDGIYCDFATVKEEHISKDIASSAFYGCANMTSITLPDDYKTVGAGAFYGCKQLEEIELPETLTSIGQNAFYDCRSFESITVPETVTYVGSNAFSGCTSLRTLNVAKVDGIKSTLDERTGTYTRSYYSLNVRNWFADMFYEEDNNHTDKNVDNNVNVQTVTLGSVRNLPANMFKNFHDLQNADITFADFENRKSWGINLSASGIGNSAFEGCNSLTFAKLKLTDEKGLLKSIGGRAFADCYSLESFTVPASVETMGNAVFEDCYRLASLTVETLDKTVERTNANGSTRQTYSTFGNIGNWFATTTDLNENVRDRMYRTYNNGPILPRSLVAVTIRNVTQLPDNCFRGWSSLETVNITFGNSLTYYPDIDYNSRTTAYPSIGSNAFRNCYNMTITVGGARNVQTIGAYAFYGCDDVTASVVNGFTKVNTIEEYAFADCGLNGEINLGTSLYTIRNNAFYNCPNITALHIGNYNRLESTGTIARLFGADTSDYHYDSQFTSVGSYYVPNKLKTVTISGIDSLASLNSNFLSNISTLQAVRLATNSSDNYVIMGSSNPFAGCTSLQKVFVPDTLKNIYLEGGATLWGSDFNTERFEIGYATGTSAPTVYTYSENSPTTYGNFWHYRYSYSNPTTYATLNGNSVTYNLHPNNGNSNNQPVTANNGLLNASSVNNITYSGHELVGWYTNESCTGAPITFPYYTQQSNSSTPVKLYAKWRETNTNNKNYVTSNSSFTVNTDSRDENVYTLTRNGSTTATYVITAKANKTITGSVYLYRYYSPTVTLTVKTANRTATKAFTSSSTSYFACDLKSGESLIFEYRNGSSSSDRTEINFTVSNTSATGTVTAPTIPNFDAFQPDLTAITGIAKSGTVTEEEFGNAIELLMSQSSSYTANLAYTNGETVTMQNENNNIYATAQLDNEVLAKIYPLYKIQESGRTYYYRNNYGQFVRYPENVSEVNTIRTMVQNLTNGMQYNSALGLSDTLYTDSATGSLYFVKNNVTMTDALTGATSRMTVVVAASKTSNGNIVISLGVYANEDLQYTIRYTDLGNTEVERPDNVVDYDEVEIL